MDTIVCVLLVLCYCASASASCFTLPQPDTAQACQKIVNYPVSTDINTDKAKNDVTQFYQYLVEQVRKATKYKKEHCVEALHSLSCFNVYKQCTEDVPAVPPCRGVCYAVSAYCNVTDSVLNCGSYPTTNCFDLPPVSGPSCAVPSPSQLSFCTMIDYNSSRTFFGPDFHTVDNLAQKAYEMGSRDLPNDRCRTIFKYELCENYFRMCNSTVGNLAMSPCPDTCEEFLKAGCTSLSHTCDGPQYGPPNECYTISLPTFNVTCGKVKINSGLNFCVMVDYNVDTTSSIKTLDAIALQSYNQLVGDMSQNHTLSAYCKSRLADFTCATTFQECPNSVRIPRKKFPSVQENTHFQLRRSTPLSHVSSIGSPEPLEPCNSFCKDVLTTCGGYAPELCELFPATDCFVIPPSSKKPCSSTSECGSGEYCFFYATGQGVCLVN